MTVGGPATAVGDGHLAQRPLSRHRPLLSSLLGGRPSNSPRPAPWVRRPPAAAIPVTVSPGVPYRARRLLSGYAAPSTADRASAAPHAAPSLLPLTEVPQQVMRRDARCLLQRLDDQPQVVVADALDAAAYLGSQVRRYLVFKHRFLVGWDGQTTVNLGK